MKLNRNYLGKFIFVPVFKNVFSFTFILCLLTESVYPSINAFNNSENVMSASRSEPVAEIGSDMVDHFSGDFGYTVPLLNIPGPNGENVDLTASYAAGITMDQRSGWLGLGWGLNVGEISRQVVGAPDDYAGQPIVTNSGNMTINNVTNITSINPIFAHNFKYGPFHYNKIQSNITCPYSYAFATPYTLNNRYSTDNLLIEGAINNGPAFNQNTYSNYALGPNYNPSTTNPFFNGYFTKPTAPYAMPAYDNYFVSGPGIGGKIHPYIFSKAITSGIDHPRLYSGTVQPGTIIQNRKTQFYFENSSFNNCSSFPNDMTNNRIRSGTYVKYYTNAEINTSTNLFNANSSAPYTGFLDYRIPSSTRRPTSQFDENAIGGIEVTNANGLTYHYSLPVMTNLNVDKSFYDNTFNLTLKKDYVISWKLTAVTGSDYKDMNNNYMADEGDVGYWVQYKYGLWDDNFFDANVLYNLKTQTSNKGETYYLNKKNFTLTSNLNQSTGAQYYLDYIRTSTHTAYFIKGIKLDDHSAEFAIGGTKVNPSLKLNRIILLRNQDKKLIENTAAWSTLALNSKFKTGLMASPKDPTLIHINKYASNKQNIDYASLKSVEFVQDYSLCKKYFSNINNSFGTITNNVVVYIPNGSGTTTYMNNALNDISKMNFGTSILYASVNPANFSTSDANNSGKLTLNEIRSFEDHGLAVFSPYTFDYRKSNNVKNPYYNPLKQDIWGYYKSDRDSVSQTNSGYVTMFSALNVDAWSLTKITLPQGGTIEVEYESDTYEREGFKDLYIPNYIIGGINHDYMKGPHLLFPVKSINCGSPCNSPPSTLTTSLLYEFDDRHHVDSCLQAYYSPNWGPNGTSFWVIPTLVSCSHLNNTVPGGANSSVADFADYWLFGDNVSPPTTSIPATYFYRYPDVQNNHCSSGILGFAGYDKTKAYGYNLIAAKKLFGGGIRVKKIKVNETSENLSYEQNIEYADGYCPVVPKKCMLGPADVNTLFALWQGNYNLLPYLNLTNVGYSEVKVTNTNKFSENNGFTKYTFKNENFTNNPLKIRPHRAGNTSTWPTGSSCDNAAITPTSSAQEKWHIEYSLAAKLSDAENEMRGKLNSIQKFDDNTSTPKEVYRKDLSYDSYSILENYSHSLGLDYNKGVAKNVTMTYVGSPNYNQLITCLDNETYLHHMSYENCGVFLYKTAEKIDGITTTTLPKYDNNTGLVIEEMKTIENVGKLITKTEYAFQTSGIGADLLKSKIDDDKNLNQLTVPYKISTYKQRYDPVSDSYLISQVKNEAFANPNQIREFLNTSTTNNPNGTYWTNTSSIYANNSIVAFESYKGLINTNTIGPNTNAPSYRLQGKPTLFSVNGKVLESFGVNNRYSAVRLGYNNLYPLTSISNARYGSFGFTSFEDTITVATGVLHFGGEFTMGSTRYGAQATIKPHTGSYMSKVNPSTTGPSLTCRLFDPGKTYEAKVWVHKSSPVNARLAINIKGVSTTSSPINNTVDVYKNNAANIQVGDWILMKCQITIPANLSYASATYLVPPDLTVFVDNAASSGISYFDDLMFNPIDIPISGNVFDMRTSRLIAVLDGENFATFMNYDAAGRPTSIYKETKDYGIKKISETDYNSCQNMQNFIQVPTPPISSPN